MLFHSYVREQLSVVPNMIRRWHAVAVRVRCSVLCRRRLRHTLPDSITTQCILSRQDVPYISSYVDIFRKMFKALSLFNVKRVQQKP